MPVAQITHLHKRLLRIFVEVLYVFKTICQKSRGWNRRFVKVYVSSSVPRSKQHCWAILELLLIISFLARQLLWLFPEFVYQFRGFVFHFDVEQTAATTDEVLLQIDSSVKTSLCSTDYYFHDFSCMISRFMTYQVGPPGFTDNSPTCTYVQLTAVLCMLFHCVTHIHRRHFV